MTVPPTLVIFGCGFTGKEIARQARTLYPRIIATVRTPEHAAALTALGLTAHALPVLTPADVERLIPEGADLVVAYPPDESEAARAPRTHAARAIAYISSTGVYGSARGRVDEHTPLDRASPRANERSAAEEPWRAARAVALRSAGIYGPGRGLHLRIARGDFRIPGDGTQTVSRIHVEDLAAATLAALARATPGSAYVAADATPVPQIEAITWLCRRLDKPLPSHIPLTEAPETLRGDRAADSTRLRHDLALTLRYPSYREGFEACITADHL